MSGTQTVLAFLAVAVLSYLLGSFNFAIIISRVFTKGDVREHGSGNAGMTNILRTYGKWPAVGTAAGDFLKAVAAVMLSRMIFSRLGIEAMDAGYVAGLFVLLGHLFPIYFGFRGGKGVITTLGIVLIINPGVFLVICAIFLPLVFIVKIVSLASVLGAIVFPMLTYLSLRLRGEPAMLDTLFAAVIAVIILIMHRGNIKRLLSGTESRFGGKKK